MSIYLRPRGLSSDNNFITQYKTRMVRDRRKKLIYASCCGIVMLTSFCVASI